MVASIDERANAILESLSDDLQIKPYIDFSLPIPSVFRGCGEIKLIFLGQDPTVKSEKSRRSIITVLNLNKKGQLRSYLEKICSKANSYLSCRVMNGMILIGIRRT